MLPDGNIQRRSPKKEAGARDRNTVRLDPLIAVSYQAARRRLRDLEVIEVEARTRGAVARRRAAPRSRRPATLMNVSARRSRGSSRRRAAQWRRHWSPVPRLQIRGEDFMHVGRHGPGASGPATPSEGDGSSNDEVGCRPTIDELEGIAGPGTQAAAGGRYRGDGRRQRARPPPRHSSRAGTRASARALVGDRSRSTCRGSSRGRCSPYPGATSRCGWCCAAADAGAGRGRRAARPCVRGLDQPRPATSCARSIRSSWCCSASARTSAARRRRAGAGDLALGPDWPGGFFLPVWSKYDLAGPRWARGVRRQQHDRCRRIASSLNDRHSDRRGRRSAPHVTGAIEPDRGLRILQVGDDQPRLATTVIPVDREQQAVDAIAAAACGRNASGRDREVAASGGRAGTTAAQRPSGANVYSWNAATLSVPPTALPTPASER